MENQHYRFGLMPLDYAYGALEPYIDERTMQIHHDGHLKTYVDNLNAALKDYPEYHGWSLERLIMSANWLPEAIRTQVKHNGGGVYNHNFFFSAMTASKGTNFGGNLAKKIDETFGSAASFKDKFKEEALKVFGSGYAWLAADVFGSVRIVTTANQDTLIPMERLPLMCIDVWEHAYYLKHQNKRAEYVDDWWSVADFDKASRLYEGYMNIKDENSIELNVNFNKKST